MATSKKTEPNIFSDNKHLIQLIFSLKYVYLGCFIVFLIIAYLYSAYFPKEYEIYASIAPIENETGNVLTSGSNMFSGMSALQQTTGTENEINNLKSFERVSSTISKLGFEIGYFLEKDNLFNRTSELYDSSPFTINIDRSHIQPINTRFYISLLSDSTFRLESYNNNSDLYNYIDNEIAIENVNILIDTICKFNHTIEMPTCKFSVSFNKEYQAIMHEDDTYFYFEFYHLGYLTKEYYRRLSAMVLSSMSSIINITFSGENVDKIITFLDTYLNTYFEESLNRKNKTAYSTIEFIDAQLTDIADSLVLSESALRSFRSANQITDLSLQGQQLQQSLRTIDEELSNFQVQERYYNYIINYFKQNRDMSGVTVPSSSGVNDPIMNQMITDLLALNTERSNILVNQNTESLFLKQIESRIEMQKQLIIENVTNNLNTLSLSMNELNYRAEKLRSEIASLPKTELKMVSIQRDYDINENIYSFLLQRRSEAAITMASNYPNYEILEPAREITAAVIAPKTTIAFLLAIFLSLFFPSAYLIIREFFNNKIQTSSYIEYLTDKPVFGIIPSNIHNTEAVVSDYPQSSIAEAFRTIRSSLFFKMKNMEDKVLLITSAQPKDGKSFFSFNIAHSIAAVGLKTIIIDCDLHRPTLHKKFNVENEKGLSNVMTGNGQLADMIQTTKQKNLFFIPAGPIIPNPSELIESGAIDAIIDKLKKEYDYVIIDTTPFGIVADAMSVIKYANQIILICRNNYTNKDLLSGIITTLETHDYDNYDIVFNDMELKHSPYGQYTSYYKKSK